MTDSVDTAPKKVKAPLWKRLYFAFTLVVLVALAADTIWVASGSGEWKLAKDEDGVKVYTLKAPGDKMLKVRTVMEGDYTLTQLTSQHIVDDNLDTALGMARLLRNLGNEVIATHSGPESIEAASTFRPGPITACHGNASVGAVHVP